MIARTWSGSANPDRADAYVAHLRDVTFPQLAAIPGHRGASVLRRLRGALIEFTVITFWESREAIARFSGDDPELAVVPPAARALLATYDSRAVHWEVVLQTQGNGADEGNG